MVSYLPKPYNDELLYSIVARYKEHTNESYTKILAQLFNAETFKLNFYMGKAINELVEQVKRVSSVGVDEFVHRHTIYPFFAAFAAKVEQEKMYNSILSVRRKINLSKIDGLKTASFKYCPVCSDEDRDVIGETYWRRCHNIPFMKTCLQHKCNLESVSMPFEEKSISNISCAESVIPEYGIPSLDLGTNNFDQECIEILQGKPVDIEFIIAKFLVSGLAKSSGTRNAVRPNAISEINEFVSKNYFYLGHLCPVISHQLHSLVNNKWTGRYPMVILLLEKFLQNKL
jgi:hypothetical protein